MENTDTLPEKSPEQMTWDAAGKQIDDVVKSGVPLPPQVQATGVYVERVEQLSRQQKAEVSALWQASKNRDELRADRDRAIDEAFSLHDKVFAAWAVVYVGTCIAFGVVVAHIHVH